MNPSETSVAERLERGELVSFEPAPFSVPAGADLAFLLEQQLQSALHKNISYNPANESLTGLSCKSAEQAARMRALMQAFSAEAASWLAGVLPQYAAHVRPDRASFRPEEEAVRRVRLTARNDLLHLDAFPSRPTRGARILRLFVNVNPSDERVWITSETFETLLSRYGTQVGLPTSHADGWARRMGTSLLSYFTPALRERTDYDQFMLRLHNFLKSNDDFQARAPRRFWHFKPQTAWLLFTDAVSHAELRGQFALEHSFFIALEDLLLPELSPAYLLERACRQPSLTHAA